MSTATEASRVLAEGKTKKILSHPSDATLAVIRSKDDITAGDGAKHDVLPGKGAWSTVTTCNVFRLLQACGIKVAFTEQLSETEFSAPHCKMIPLEVIVRREAHGSYLKRNPHITKGQVFSRLIYELYLKTSGKEWDNAQLPCDDPMIQLAHGKAVLFKPSEPLWGQNPFLQVPLEEILPQYNLGIGLSEIEKSARRTFLVLEKAWQILGQRLVDFKIEFGFHHVPPLRQILLSDVIDSDSWRKLKDGQYSDKQIYRDGGPLAEVAAKFSEAAELTSRFDLPRQRIIIWRGSEKDNTAPIEAEIDRLGGHYVDSCQITCSGHKQPARLYQELQQAIQEFPDSVVLASIGMSNGAGPTLAANCTVPVITVPASAKEFPDDVWSSLRAPSNVPVMTVLKPENAVLAAIQILAARNPALYANLRYEQEKRLDNCFLIG